MVSRRYNGYALLLGMMLLCVSTSMAAPQSTFVLPKIYLPFISAPPPYRIAFVHHQDGTEELYVMNIDGGTGPELPTSQPPLVTLHGHPTAVSLHSQPMG